MSRTNTVTNVLNPHRCGGHPDKFPPRLKESEWRWNHRQVNLYSLPLKETRSHPLN
jgi:hypothetical protein